MPELANRVDLLFYLKHGGPFMWPLYLCSIVGLAVIIFKWHELWRKDRASQGVPDAVEKKVQVGDRSGAVAFCEATPSPVSGVLLAVLGSAGADRETVREAAEDARTRETHAMEAFLPALATVANIAPLLGFLGTVWGMILAFHEVAIQRHLGPEVVAGGIWQALITTAAGLIIAIPCFAAYNYFVSRLNASAIAMERASTRLIHAMNGEGGPHAAAHAS